MKPHSLATSRIVRLVLESKLHALIIFLLIIYFLGETEKVSYDFLEMFFKAYAKLNLPMQITEITVTGYRGNVLDEEFQADMIERLYSYWFSVEKMEAIIYWNMNDGYAAFAKPGDMTEGENRFRGGLVDFDGRKKPCYERLNNLINKVWHTEFVLESDENGCVEQSAFYGKYNFNIFKDYKTESLNMDFSVNDNGKTKKIIL